MGKSRRNRGGASQRRDPIAKPIKPPADPELAAIREATIMPILNDLKSADPKSRTKAATAITNIIQQPKCRKLLLREQIVHTILTQTLTDAALESRAAGWGILQVLAEEEEVDFCVHLFRSEVVTAMQFAAATLTEQLRDGQTFAKLPQAEAAFVTSIIASIVALATALAEAGDDLLQAVASSADITNLLFLLIAQGAGESSRVSNLLADSLACLMVLTEDNGSLSGKVFSTKPCYEALCRLKDLQTGDGVLACAALHSVLAALEESKHAAQIPDEDDSALVSTLVYAVSSIKSNTESSGQGWSDPFEQQQLALETLAAIGTTLNSVNVSDAAAKTPKQDAAASKDDEDMGDVDAAAAAAAADDEDKEEEHEDEEEDEDEDEEMDQDEMEADMEMVTGADVPDENIDDLPVLKALLDRAVPELVRVASMQPEDDQALQLQAHALSALNNIAWSVSIIDFDEPQNRGIRHAWTPVGLSLWTSVVTPILASDTADMQLATSVTGLAWAVARTLSSQDAIRADGHHEKFMSLYTATRGLPDQDDADPFQRLSVKCIGVLGQLATDPCPVDTNRAIGAFLLDVLAGDAPASPADAVEVLNQLFDVYGNEDFQYDKDVFWAGGFLARFDTLLPKMRTIAKGVDKKQFPELKTRADEAVLNLTRFLAYKRKKKSE